MNVETKPADALAQGNLSEEYPDEQGHSGIFGGSFIAETLMDPVSEVQEAYSEGCAQ